MKQRRWMSWSLIFGVWTLVGLFFASQLYLIHVRTDWLPKTITWGQALTWALTDSYLWAILSPFVLRLARCFRLERRNWLHSLLIHLPAGGLFSLLQLGLYVSVPHLVSRAFGSPFPFWELFQALFLVKFHIGIMTYWAILIISHTIDYYRKYRERELRASQLEAQLAQAQLQALKMQLHPHFLFNTLHSISALMHKDLEAADRMITRLGDFLRMTLENAGAQEVALHQELEFLKHYLEIEQMRFEDRLRVQFDIEPETLNAQVPNLILQPLVENAIRHGIAPRAAPGQIEIHAKRKNGVLELQVKDNGPGLVRAFKEGVGLSNTRVRLQQLYGPAHRFELSNAPGGGLVVTLEIPFKLDA